VCINARSTTIYNNDAGGNQTRHTSVSAVGESTKQIEKGPAVTQKNKERNSNNSRITQRKTCTDAYK
jgi:hypothetical protein